MSTRFERKLASVFDRMSVKHFRGKPHRLAELSFFYLICHLYSFIQVIYLMQHIQTASLALNRSIKKRLPVHPLTGALD